MRSAGFGLVALAAIAACVAPIPRNSNGTPQRLEPSAADVPGRMKVLPYSALGVPASLYEVLGNEWYAWENGGNYELGDRFDVRVVVFQGVPIDAVQARYPVVPGRADHRYLEYAQALKLIDSELELVGANPEGSLPALAAQLRETRLELQHFFGELPRAGRPQ